MGEKEVERGVKMLQEGSYRLAEPPLTDSKQQDEGQEKKPHLHSV